jgi:hypothetical protein
MVKNLKQAVKLKRLKRQPTGKPWPHAWSYYWELYETDGAFQRRWKKPAFATKAKGFAVKARTYVRSVLRRKK